MYNIIKKLSSTKKSICLYTEEKLFIWGFLICWFTYIIFVLWLVTSS
jgi:hypothetical protein